MPVDLEQIERLKEKAHISYGEAKEVLEKHNGDVLEALIDLEGQRKVKTCKMGHSECRGAVKNLFHGLGRLVKKGNEIKFIIKKEENKIIDIPLNLVIVVTVIVTPLTVVGVLLALFTGHKIRLTKPNGGDMEINKAFDKISTAVNSVSSQVAEAVNKKE